MGNPQVVVLSGPSGVGKDTVIEKLRTLNHHRHFVVTATTRTQRNGEQNGVAYHFLSESTFQQMLKDGEFIEYAKVYNNWYGVPKQEIRQGLSENKDVIIKLDIQGSETIKRIIPQSILIFITSPSQEELCRRLSERGTETDENLQLRLETAKYELKNIAIFDHIVVNEVGMVENTVAEINTIIESEKKKSKTKIVL